MFVPRDIGDTSDNRNYIEEHPAWVLIPNDICGIPRERLKPRIIGGREADLGQFPWMVRLGKYFVKHGRMHRIFTCGGALITKLYVLTAAHCGSELNIVRVGENRIGSKNCDMQGCAPKTQNIFIKNLFLSNYSTDDFRNDIMLVQLQGPVEFNDFVKPVCLPRGNLLSMNPLGKYFRIAGWGKTNSNENKISQKLMFFSGPVLNDGNCNTIFKHPMVDSQYCVGFQKGKDSCIGDSGGPMTRAVKINGKKQTYIFGIVSYGLTDCGEGPGIYTRVISFLPWILDNIKEY
ncbi:CLIP domain-containing serine protease HP8 isoform X1 [Leptinotarsa decemlineata]|uniref:CLIP domain-containing serine protease HP8 isoform X1 n=1 Tax=Leptinotarsa decemlineata TaxID=7539 RepID=UPI003D30C0D2